MKLFGLKKTVTLIGNQKESRWKLMNPGRGFLRVYQFKLEDPFDSEQLDTVIAHDETMALVEISLAAYKAENIDEGGLNHLHHIMIYFRRKKMDVILRVCYDMHGETVASEPTELNQVLRHMDQVAEVLSNYKSEIFLIQGLMVGRWGEMHSSRYTTDETLRKLYRRFRMSKIGDLSLAVRTPELIRLLSAENEVLAYDEPFLTNLDDIGLFDDAILSDDTDMGTFMPGQKENEFAYIKQRCARVPVGGEAIAGEETFAVKDVIEEFEGLGINYLNSQYDKRQLNNWDMCEYGGMSLREYIDLHLGYRIFLKELVWDKKNEVLILDIENRGFGGLLETVDFMAVIDRRVKKDLTLPENVDLTGEDMYEYKREQRLKYRLNRATLGGGKSLRIEMPIQELPKGQYILNIQMTRNKDGRRIYFANDNAEFIERVPMVQS
ncbi:MAG: DUF4874 domain-containing protein [Lachnospiraceae bacterium]|nr:DUF4874 domain-containing protein [Lachnospiraceae bacterium]